MELNNLSTLYGDIAYDIDDQSTKTYVRFQALHLRAFRLEINCIKDMITSENIPEETYRDFLLNLVKYEKKNEYNYTKSTYKAICGIRIEILLPRKLTSKSKRAELARKFMKEVNPIGYKIPWIAYLQERGTATYMNILLSEREYVDHTQNKVYLRNYYDKEGAVTHKKGEVMMKNGQPIKEHVLWSNKVRLFTYNRRNFKHLIKELTEKFIVAVTGILKRLEHRFRIKQRTISHKWHYYNRKVCTEINNAKKYVEFACNHALTIQKSKTDPWIEEQLARSAPVPKMKELTSLFHKYKARFEKESFHDSKGELRKIAYHRVPLDILQENLRDLKQEFRHELGILVPEVFKML